MSHFIWIIIVILLIQCHVLYAKVTQSEEGSRYKHDFTYMIKHDHYYNTSYSVSWELYDNSDFVCLSILVLRWIGIIAGYSMHKRIFSTLYQLITHQKIKQCPSHPECKTSTSKFNRFIAK